MPDLVHSMILIFADDTKIFRKIDTLEDYKKLQKDLNKLMRWSADWQLRFNALKYKAMHLGYINQATMVMIIWK